MSANKNIILPAIIVSSIFVSCYEVWLYLADKDGSTSALLNLWLFIYPAMLVFWVDIDSRNYKFIERPYEYGFLIFVYWLFYLPYYLWRTRSYAGIAMLLGFLFMYQLGYLINWLIYFVS